MAGVDTQTGLSYYTNSVLDIDDLIGSEDDYLSIKKVLKSFKLEEDVLKRNYAAVLNSIKKTIDSLLEVKKYANIMQKIDKELNKKKDHYPEHFYKFCEELKNVEDIANKIIANGYEIIKNEQKGQQ